MDDNMNDEEIMKKFNETFSDQPLAQNNSQPENVIQYRATSNLNTVNNPVNPTMVNNLNNNISSNPLGETKKTVNELLSSDTYIYTNNTVNNTNNQSNVNQYQSNVNYNYVSTYTDNKNKKKTIKLSKENIVFIVIIIILFIVIMIIPSIYEFIRNIKMM